MGKIDNRREILSHVNAFHTPWDSFKRGNSLHRNIRIDSQTINGRTKSGKTIQYVVSTNQLTCYINLKIFALRGEMNPRGTIRNIHRADIRTFTQSIIQFVHFDKVIEKIK